jgi:hypothetical protein
LVLMSGYVRLWCGIIWKARNADRVDHGRGTLCNEIYENNGLIPIYSGENVFFKKANRQKVLRKPKGIKAEYPGHIVALDTVERFVHGLRRYIITCEDIHLRFAFA